VFWYILSSVWMAICAISIYIYYYQKGQFDDPEDVKYQMFRNEVDEEDNAKKNTHNMD
jgi:nitrogen fixation-related uncharacterized protein